MKSKIGVVIIAFFLLMSLCSIAMGSPVIGIWNDDITGLGNEFNGVFNILPYNGNFGIGDELMIRDNLSSTPNPSSAEYWFATGLIRYQHNVGSLVSDGSVSYKSIQLARKDGTFFIRGDNLWNQENEKLYTVTVQADYFGKLYFNGSGGFEHAELTAHMWGGFDNEPYLFSSTANMYIAPGYSTYYGTHIMTGTYNDFEMEITAAPVPPTILLLGSGLLGLIGINSRKKRG